MAAKMSFFSGKDIGIGCWNENVEDLYWSNIQDELFKKSMLHSTL